MMGYSDTSKAYRLWNLRRRIIIVARDVKFNEKIPKFIKIPTELQNKQDEDIEDLQEEPPVEEEKPQPGPSNTRKYRLRKEIQSDLGEYWKPTMRDDDEHVNPLSILATTIEEPQNYKEAINSKERKEWKKAMDEEFESLKKNNTWKLVTRPKDQPVISS